MGQQAQYGSFGRSPLRQNQPRRTGGVRTNSATRQKANSSGSLRAGQYQPGSAIDSLLKA